MLHADNSSGALRRRTSSEIERYLWAIPTDLDPVNSVFRPQAGSSEYREEISVGGLYAYKPLCTSLCCLPQLDYLVCLED